MTPEERALTALRRGQADRVRWAENEVEAGLQIRIMGARDEYRLDCIVAFHAGKLS